MAKKKPAKPLDAWSHTEGTRGSIVTVEENWSKSGAVYVRYTFKRAPKRKSLSVYLGHSQPFTLRNSRGQLLATRQKEAVAAAQAVRQDLLIGLDPFRDSKVPTPSNSKQKAPPTVKEALDMALRSSRGMFVTESKHKGDMLRASDRILAALPKGMLCEEVIPSTAETVWRHLLEQAEHVKSYRRVAEQTVGTLFTVLKWAHEREPHRFPAGKVAMSNWKNKLLREWEQKFPGQKAVQAERDKPRFTPEETRRLFAGLEEADQRVALIIELTAEQRPGQVIRAKRSMLKLGPIGGYGLGALDLTDCGRGKKHTTIVELHPQARVLVDRVLKEGYLSELEAAFKAKEIDDYYLWPAGQLSKEGKMPVDRYLAGPQRRNGRGEIAGEPRHMDAGSMIELFRAYQESVGVTVKKRRQLYGLRRVLSDRAEDVQKDERVLNELQGWKDTQTRRDYQQDKDPRILKAAAETRHEIRAEYRPLSEAEKIRLAAYNQMQKEKLEKQEILKDMTFEQFMKLSKEEIFARLEALRSEGYDPNITRSDAE